MRISVLVCAAALAGCASSFQVIDAALPKLTGQPIDRAIDYLGVPDRQYEVAGRQVYVWGTVRHATYVIPNTSTTTGWVGNVPVQASTTTYKARTDTLTCELKAIVVGGRISDWDYEGNNGACVKYARRLEPLAKQRP